MIDPMADGSVPRCPWCSSPLLREGLEACPECGATLVGPVGAEPQLPGVTTLDAEAILRARSEVTRPRSRLLSFITGEPSPAVELDPAARASIAPPSEAVRREMQRLQLAAELAALEAEVEAMAADAALPGPAGPEAVSDERVGGEPGMISDQDADSGPGGDPAESAGTVAEAPSTDEDQTGA